MSLHPRNLWILVRQMDLDPKSVWRRVQCRMNKHRVQLIRAGQHWAIVCLWCSFYRTWSPVTRGLYNRWKAE